MRCLLLVITLISIVNYSYADDKLIPKQLEWEGKRYNLAPWNDEYKGVVYGDFDGDGQDEAIANFRAIEEGDTEILFPHVFHTIYDFVDNKPVIVKTIKSIDERLDNVEVIDLPDVEGKLRKTIAIFGGGGMHYTALEIYQYRNGEYEQIFINGSSCLVEIKKDTSPLQIWIGRANWEKEGWCYADPDCLWQVYTWSGDKFDYNDELSTSVEISEEEEFLRYAHEYKERLSKIQNGSDPADR